jgi:DNA-binding beta-propeller fold protein YncE
MLMVRRAAVVLAGVLVLGALGAGSAFGALSYPFAGQLAPAGGSFEHEVQGIAVGDANGQTYVAESGGVVNVFETASGTQLTSWNGSAASNPPGTPAGSFGGGELAVAADNASGRVYVLDSTNDVVDVLDSAGGYVCQITGRAVASASECNGVAGSDTPAHGFNTPRGITVDQATGRVYVVDANNGVVDVFSAGGAYLPSSSLSLASIEGGYSALYTRAVAVDDANGHVYLADSGSVVVYEFGASGEFLAKWHGANTPAGSFGGGYDSVAADNAGGEVFVTDTQHGVTDVFDSSGAYMSQFGGSAGASQVTAVDQAGGKVYVANHTQAIEVFGPGLVIPDVTTGAASGVLPTGATLNGMVDPDGVQLSDCHFEYGTDTSYGHSAPCVPAAGAIPADSSEHAVSATLTGLVAGTTYHFRLVGANTNGPNTGADATFSTPPPPTIENASARNITSVSADLSASVDPNGYNTTYRFEWGTSTSYGTSVPVPDADIGAGTNIVPVTTRLSGLSTNTTYHWRFVAQNANGTTTGVDHTFVYSTAGAMLPDGRAYEMVTPVQKNVALIGLGFGVTIEADVAENGSRVILPSLQCFAGASSCIGQRGSAVGDPYAFTRTSAGWSTVPLAPPEADINRRQSFSADSGLALFLIPTAPGGEDDWYASSGGGSLARIGPVTYPAYGATPISGVASAPPVVTPNMSHIVWSAPVIPFVWPFDATNPGGGFAWSVYEYAGTGGVAPALVGVTGGSGSTDLIGTCGTRIGSLTPGTLSADGRVVFFNVSACSSGSGVNTGVAVPSDEVWARIGGARSVRLSARSPSDCSGVCLSSPEGDAAFWGASSDGSRAIFTSVQQLTNDATQDGVAQDEKEPCNQTSGVNGCNLYLYDFSLPAGQNLVDVSAGDTSGGGPRVRGVVDVSNDGSHVYFVAQGVLSAAANDQGEVAHDGANNLYVYERDAAYPEGHTAFIASLPLADQHEWEGENSFANVTPDGRLLVFRSHGDLTADDTSVSGASQLFRYDAQSGQLVRISVGDRGFDDNGNRPTATTCSREGAVCSEDVQIVQPKARGGYASDRSDPTMSHDGSYVFFMSPLALAPGALNDIPIGTSIAGVPSYVKNVYEWHAGRVYLISDGKDTSQHIDESDVWLVGSDATGANVFFSTADPLVAGDTDTQMDIYDARVCTVGEPCVSSVAPVESGCQGEACHAPPGAAPGLPSVASSTLAGAGNLAPAPTGKRKVVVKKHPKPKKRRRAKRRQGKKKRGHKAAAGGRARGKSGVRS